MPGTKKTATKGAETQGKDPATFELLVAKQLSWVACRVLLRSTGGAAMAEVRTAIRGVGG